jgi:hypothetical protein
VSSYYYLMAQLPGILSNVPLPISYETFSQTASRFLSTADNAILEGLSLEPPRMPSKTGSSLVDRFYVRERALRLSLERLRASKLKRDIDVSYSDDLLIGNSYETIQIARNAAGFDNPLEAELYLIHNRFDFVDQLRGNHFFDSDAVFAYGLMLLLHERSDKFTAEAGRASYTTIYKAILGE